ncbi:hypothetical protein NDU88_005834 [Pleurodeles waltl]|uniref:Uncharacterized protein n=1 Tax=Pleurodeles waltl TaxID=8319 RepID=A0AAV7TWR2_PLEWA|nr:hypothetical protein NDU88_005834 [Pleurodeles waltl]
MFRRAGPSPPALPVSRFLPSFCSLWLSKVRSRPLCFSQSAEVMPKGALPAAQFPECLAAAILSPLALFRLASSPFVSEPKLAVSGGQKPNINSPGGHHAFRSLCAESGAELSIIAPGTNEVDGDVLLFVGPGWPGIKNSLLINMD